jgi:hypothetical protein
MHTVVNRLRRGDALQHPRHQLLGRIDRGGRRLSDRLSIGKSVVGTDATSTTG